MSKGLKSKNLKEKLSLGYSLARSAHFAAQQLPLPLFEILATGQPKDHPIELESIKHYYKELYALLKKDSQNITQGFYPIDVLKPEPWHKHMGRCPQLLMDSFYFSRRRRDHRAKEFNQEAREYLPETPEYYRRNFHYQNDGYLTKKSAELYEHQVEVLFTGSADAMRRLIIPMIKSVYPGDGDGLHFLEVGAGTGRLTRFMKLAYPKARITVLDLSDPYLKKAQENLAEFHRLDFIQGAAEELPFKSARFDFVYSCFLFHELPEDIRREVLAESYRVLKQGGFFGFVDSVQKQDNKELEWALRQFPVDFHEPFYKNYIETNMEDLVLAQDFVGLRKDIGLFSKAVIAQKPFSA